MSGDQLLAALAQRSHVLPVKLEVREMETLRAMLLQRLRQRLSIPSP
jgi:hypothetical protein